MSGSPAVIGITGGIGSGKSTVCKVFEVLGARTYYADDRAKWLMVNDSSLIAGIKKLFGEEAYKNGNLDRTHIAKMAFENAALLQSLNELVHPAVAKDVNKWIESNQDAKILLKEAALLFETGSYKELDQNVLVTAEEEVRIQRVLARDSHRTEEDVKNIIAKQMSDSEKMKLADFVIENDGSQSLIKQVMQIHQSIVTKD